jgi:hypothetical protein
MNLEHAEEQIWRCWAMWQGTTWSGEVMYPRSFSIQDKVNDIQMYRMAKQSNIADSRINKVIDRKIFETIVEAEFEQYIEDEGIEAEPIVHMPMQNAELLITHMREMIESGMSDEQIIETHPEIGDLFGGTPTDA